MAQPDMDYLAPEIQLGTAPFASPSCDMFSLGMLICAVYNGGKSIIQSSHNPVAYTKQIDRVCAQQPYAFDDVILFIAE